MTYAKKGRAAIVALALMLMLPTATFAVEATSTETLTVQSTITMTGVPASLAYGSGLGGATLSAPEIHIALATNNFSGANLAVRASDLARTGGNGTIASTARRVRISFSGTSTGWTATAPYVNNAAAPGNAYPGPANATSQLANGTQATSGLVVDTVMSVVVPAGAVPGTYTGSVTFVFTDNP